MTVEGTSVGGPARNSNFTSAGTIRNGNFLAACRGLPHDTVPVWFMRQAGRALPEYRAIRGSGSILETIANVELATEITLQPVRRYGVDAAVLFSDIMVPIHAIGFGMDIIPGIGPVAEQPFATATDLKRLRPLEPPEDIPYVLDTIAALTNELSVPLIGFAGGPFTLASYLIEGAPSRTFHKTKALMLGHPELWQSLMARLTDLTITFLAAQANSGASALQIFDSWAGALHPKMYATNVWAHLQRILAETAELGLPRICFGVGAGELLGLFAESGAEVVGVDWRVPLSEARRRTHNKVALQGNLDPAVCLAPWPVVAQEAEAVLAESGSHPGYVFNLGHGVLPETDPAILEQLVELVHTKGRVKNTEADVAS